MRLACGCQPAHGQDCDWCNGVNAELGITPPTPEPLVYAGPASDDPWLDTTQPLEPPF